MKHPIKACTVCGRLFRPPAYLKPFKAAKRVTCSRRCGGIQAARKRIARQDVKAEEGLPPAPTPKQIRQRCKEVRSGWTRQQRGCRLVEPRTVLPRVYPSTLYTSPRSRVYL